MTYFNPDYPHGYARNSEVQPTSNGEQDIASQPNDVSSEMQIPAADEFNWAELSQTFEVDEELLESIAFSLQTDETPASAHNDVPMAQSVSLVEQHSTRLTPLGRALLSGTVAPQQMSSVEASYSEADLIKVVEHLERLSREILESNDKITAFKETFLRTTQWGANGNVRPAGMDKKISSLMLNEWKMNREPLKIKELIFKILIRVFGLQFSCDDLSFAGFPDLQRLAPIAPKWVKSGHFYWTRKLWEYFFQAKRGELLTLLESFRQDPASILTYLENRDKNTTVIPLYFLTDEHCFVWELIRSPRYGIEGVREKSPHVSIQCSSPYEIEKFLEKEQYLRDRDHRVKSALLKGVSVEQVLQQELKENGSEIIIWDGRNEKGAVNPASQVPAPVSQNILKTDKTDHEIVIEIFGEFKLLFHDLVKRSNPEKLMFKDNNFLFNRINRTTFFMRTFPILNKFSACPAAIWSLKEFLKFAGTHLSNQMTNQPLFIDKLSFDLDRDFPTIMPYDRPSSLGVPWASIWSDYIKVKEDELDSLEEYLRDIRNSIKGVSENIEVKRPLFFFGRDGVCYLLELHFNSYGYLSKVQQKIDQDPIVTSVHKTIVQTIDKDYLKFQRTTINSIKEIIQRTTINEIKEIIQSAGIKQYSIWGELGSYNCFWGDLDSYNSYMASGKNPELSDSEKEMFCNAWKSLYEQYILRPNNLKRLRNAIKQDWISEESRGSIYSAVTAAIKEEILRKVRSLKGEISSRASSHFLSHLGLEVSENVNRANYSSLSLEEAEAVWESFWELKLKELDEIFQDPLKLIEDSSEKVEHLPCLFIQSVKFPGHTHLFPWCIVRSSKGGVVGVFRQSNAGEEQEAHKRILDSQEVVDYQISPKALRPIDQLRLWERVAKEFEQGNEVVPLMMHLDNLGAGSAVFSKTKKAGFSEPRIPKMNRESSSIKENMLKVLQADSRKKKRRKKRKTDDRPSKVGNELTLHDAEIPEWLKKLMAMKGSALLEAAKEIMMRSVSRVQKQTRRSEILSESFQLPDLNSFDQLSLENARKTYLLDSLRDYQKRSMDRFEMWRAHGLNGLFADAPGLGKTRKGCEIILRMLIENPDRPVIVIAPNLVKAQWGEEFRKTVGASAIRNALRMLQGPCSNEAGDLLLQLIRSQNDLILEAFKIPGMSFETLVDAYDNIVERLSGTAQFRFRKHPVSPDDLKPFLWIKMFQEWVVEFALTSGTAGPRMLYESFVSDGLQGDDLKRFRTFQNFYARYQPGEKVFRVLNSHKEFAEAAQRGGAIVTQPSHLINADKEMLHAVQPSVIIADEAHDFLIGKNGGGLQVFEELFKQWNCPKVGLTATPIVNKTEDLISLLAVLNPEKVEKKWVDTFNGAFSVLVDQLRVGLRKNRRGKIENVSQSVDFDVVKNALYQLLWFKMKVIHPLVDRQTWEGLIAEQSVTLDQAPPKKMEVKFRITPTESQRVLYDKIRSTVDNFLKRSHLVASLMIHPYLVEQQGLAADYIDLQMSADDCKPFYEMPSTEALNDFRFKRVCESLDRAFGENEFTVLHIKGGHAARLIKHLASETYPDQKRQIQIASTSDLELRHKINKFQKNGGRLFLVFEGREVVYHSVSSVKDLCAEIRQMSEDKLREFVGKSALLEKLFYSEKEKKTLTGTISDDERAIIFVKHKLEAELLQSIAMRRYDLASERVPIVHSDVANREDLVSRFKTLDGKGILFLLPKSGGAGLNFTDVYLNILCTLEWTSKDKKQCVGRIMRGVGDKYIGLIHCDMKDTTHLRKIVNMKECWENLFLDSVRISSETLGYYAKELLKTAHSTMRASLDDSVIPQATFKQILNTISEISEVKIGKIKDPEDEDLDEDKVNDARNLAIYFSHLLLDSASQKLREEFKIRPNRIDQIIIEFEMAMASDPNYRMQMNQIRDRLIEEGPRSRWKRDFHQYLHLIEKIFDDASYWDEFQKRQEQVDSVSLPSKNSETTPAEKKRGGIANAGSTCFMASALQAIASIPALRANFNRSDEPLRSAAAILSDIAEGRSVSAKTIQEFRVECAEKGIAKGIQGFEDASEFLGKLLEAAGASHELTATFSDTPAQPSLFQDMPFLPGQDTQGYSDLEYLQSYNKSFNLSVTPMQGQTMQTLIDDFWMPEHLDELHTIEDGFKRTYMGAHRVKTPVPATLPNILMIDVKQNVMQKVAPLSVEYIYPIGALGPRYHLKAILHHEQTPVPHYYARVRLEDGSVVEANDATVHSVQTFEGFPGTLYLYERVEDAEMENAAQSQSSEAANTLSGTKRAAESLIEKPPKAPKAERELVASYFSKTNQSTRHYHLLPLPTDHPDPYVLALKIGYGFAKGDAKSLEALEKLQGMVINRHSREEIEQSMSCCYRLGIGNDMNACISGLRSREVTVLEYRWAEEKGGETVFTRFLTPQTSSGKVISILRDNDRIYLMVAKAS